MSRVFIDRPIFAWVIAILIMLLGLAAINRLPIAQYPDVAPPQVNVLGTVIFAVALAAAAANVIVQQRREKEGS